MLNLDLKKIMHFKTRSEDLQLSRLRLILMASPNPTNPVSQFLLCNSTTRIRSRDMFMLMALWMEKYPADPAPTYQNQIGQARATGCVLVDTKDRIVALDRTGESHAIVRAILSCPSDPRGFDM